ncbi:ANTAR domain-containing protein [Streptomyces gobitricini]|uniref:ANTAR domain-containing protein n=1 Tax=Streptomyces gobitricini TaxID=68211 RepID=A0ABN3LYK7_9ACTN
MEQNECARLTAEVTQLRQALDSRSVIDRAQGMVMALAPCPAERAWRVLVETSQHGNTKLRDVAAALVATAEGHRLPARLRAPFARALRHARAGSGGAGRTPTTRPSPSAAGAGPA